MKKRKAKPPATPAATGETPASLSAPDIPPPIDVVDGIPDRRPTRPLWIHLLLAGLFLAWVLFLVFVQLHG